MKERTRPARAEAPDLHLAARPDPFAVIVASCLSPDVDKTADDLAAEIFGEPHTAAQRNRVYQAVWRLRDYGFPVRKGGYLLDARDAGSRLAVRRWINANTRPVRKRKVSPKPASIF